MKIVAYYRVRGGKQSSSGLELEPQKKSVADLAKHNSGRVIAEYTEEEVGKQTNRPALKEAIAHAKQAKATLVIARLDRLTRNVSFTTILRESGVDFIACDNPHANRQTIQIMAAMAENDAVAVSRRTKDALAAAKAQGTKLGSARPGHWKGRENKRGWKQGAKQSAKLRTQRANDAYAFILPKMRELETKFLADGDGPVYERIADYLNDEGHLTTAGKPFTGTATWRILKRAQEEAHA